MNNIIKQKKFKKIIYIIVILMLCNFIVPNFAFAAETKTGGSLLTPVAQFFCFIPDTVLNFLQHMFVSNYSIDETADETYKIYYSPALIFSNKIPAMDIDYIGQNKEKADALNPIAGGVVVGDGTNKIEINSQEFEKKYASSYNTIVEMGRELQTYGYTKGENTIKLNGKGFGNGSYNSTVSVTLTEIIRNLGIKWIDGKSEYSLDYDTNPRQTDTENVEVGFGFTGNGFWTKVYFYNVIVNGKEYDEVGTIYQDIEGTAINEDMTYIYNLSVRYGCVYDKSVEELVENARIPKGKEITSYNYMSVEKEEGADEGTEYLYTTFVLRPVIASWYKALRRIALVGLLSVLLYIGIKIVMSSTSAKDKAKYKGMLKDWLMALCLLFVLHYLMAFIITVTDKIIDMISISATGTQGEDIFLSTIRTKIASEDNWGEAFVEVIMYMVLAIYTVIFTIQYLKRTIYIAFLTTIAPLICFTYPLDKIKDNKAQAFDKWLKDYVFFALLPIVHLLAYNLLIGNAIDLANDGNWIYALVAMGFLTQAEKLIKKMFGFEKSTSMGAITAGATGALVMNAINKIGHMGPKGAPGGPGGPGGKAGQANSVKTLRTATNKNPLSALQTGNLSAQANSLDNEEEDGEEDSGTPRQSSSPAPVATTGAGTQQGSGSNAGSTGSSGNTGGSENTGGSASTRTNSTPITSSTLRAMAVANNNQNTGKPKRSIKNGAGAVLKKYARPTLRSAARMGIGGTGAMLGFAAGISEGNFQSALTGLAAGWGAGTAVGNKFTNFAENTVDGAKNFVERPFGEIKDSVREAKYGSDTARNMRFDEEFRASESYSKLKESKGFSDDKVQKMLDAGITDSKRMGKILDKTAQHPRKYSIEKAIGYSALAEKCPDGILYDNTKFIRYLQDRKINIDPDELESMRKCIIEFK